MVIAIVVSVFTVMALGLFVYAYKVLSAQEWQRYANYVLPSQPYQVGGGGCSMGGVCPSCGSNKRETVRTYANATTTPVAYSEAYSEEVVTRPQESGRRNVVGDFRILKY